MLFCKVNRKVNLFLLLLISSYVGSTKAAVDCMSDSYCQQLYKTPDTACVEDKENKGTFSCSNPFQRGCLPDRVRICNSDDIKRNATAKGLCELHELDYPEIRIATQTWEGALFQTWMYQILLMEVVGVPATVGLNTGNTENFGFYSPVNTMQFGEFGYPYWALEKANQVEDSNCSKTTEDCAHLLIEDWGIDYQPFLQNGTLAPPASNGQIGKMSLYIPSHTAQFFPELSIFFGLRGEDKRQKLAEIFKRPTTWQAYCEEISSTNCTVPDETAQGAPSPEQGAMYFLQGEYQGYFRATEKNNCNTSEPCSGHVVAPPCDWNMYLDGMLYWNDIVGLEPDGPNPPAGSYDYGTMYQVWRAANATRSHIIMSWYSPEALTEEFFGSDYAFLEVMLPPPTDACSDARTSEADRCSDSILTRRGNPVGACDKEAKALIKGMATSLAAANNEVEKAAQSPAYELVKNIKISELDMNRIFRKWVEPGTDRYGNDARAAVCGWMRDNYEHIQWFVPYGFPKEVSPQQQYEEWFVVLAQLIAIFVGFIAVIGIGLCWLYRKTKIMVFSQPEFIFLMLVGYLSICIGAAVQAMKPTQDTCITMTWCLLMGITVELVPVLVKTSAINHLVQSSKKSQRVNINRRTLLAKVFACVLIVAGFMVAWTLVDAPEGKVTKKLDRDDPSIVITDLRCGSEYYYWRIAAYVWEVFLLVLAAVLAYQSRGVLKQFNESNSLGILVYSHFMFMLLRGINNIFYYGDEVNYATVTALLSLNYSIDTLIAMLIYIFPKFKVARKQPISYHQGKLRSAGATSQKSTMHPDDDLRILCCTANIGNAEPTQESMEAWIPPRGACERVKSFDGTPLHRDIFDMIVIGMQESTWTEVTGKMVPAAKEEMDEEDILNAMEEHHTATLRGLMQDILGREYSPIVEELRGQMRLFIWASNGVVDDLTQVRVDGANTGIGGVMANKGGIVVSLKYKSTRLSFLTAHLAAHEGESYYKARCDNIKTILKESSTYDLSTKLDAAVSSHHMFVMGDLNFRTKFDGDGKHEDNVKRALGFVRAKDYQGLYDFDELQQGLAAGDLLLEFDTLPCLFPPTFKVQRQGGFDYKEQRTPSYADRILYKSAQGLHDNLTPIAYEPCVDFVTSDHKPIRGAFNISTQIEDSCYGKESEIKLEFHGLQCSGLPAADANGKSDPYLLFLWDDTIAFRTDKKSFRGKIRNLINGTSWPRTKFIPKTLNPKWLGQTISLVANKLDMNSEGMLFVLAMDYDTFAVRDDFLGALALPIREIANMMNEETTSVLSFDRPLQAGGKGAGRIKFQLGVEITSKDASPFARRRSSVMFGNKSGNSNSRRGLFQGSTRELERSRPDMEKVAIL